MILDIPLALLPPYTTLKTNVQTFKDFHDFVNDGPKIYPIFLNPRIYPSKDSISSKDQVGDRRVNNFKWQVLQSVKGPSDLDYVPIHNQTEGTTPFTRVKTVNFQGVYSGIWGASFPYSVVVNEPGLWKVKFEVFNFPKYSSTEVIAVIEQEWEVLQKSKLSVFSGSENVLSGERWKTSVGTVLNVSSTSVGSGSVTQTIQKFDENTTKYSTSDPANYTLGSDTIEFNVAGRYRIFNSINDFVNSDSSLQALNKDTHYIYVEVDSDYIDETIQFPLIKTEINYSQNSGIKSFDPVELIAPMQATVNFSFEPINASLILNKGLSIEIYDLSSYNTDDWVREIEARFNVKTISRNNLFTIERNGFKYPEGDNWKLDVFEGETLIGIELHSLPGTNIIKIK